MIKSDFQRENIYNIKKKFLRTKLKMSFRNPLKDIVALLTANLLHAAFLAYR